MWCTKSLLNANVKKVNRSIIQQVNLKEQGRLLRQNEFLVWEGRSGKKSLRQVFLFEELILFSKARRFPDRKNLDLYIYKNSIKMTDIGLTAKIGESPTKFEIWFRKRKPNDTFTLQSMSEDVKKAWTEELSQLLWKQAIKNRGNYLKSLLKRFLTFFPRFQLFEWLKCRRWVLEINRAWTLDPVRIKSVTDP